MKDVPMIAESSYPGAVAENRYPFVSSSKVPQPIQECWNRELVRALGDPEVRVQLAKHFLEPNPSSREELAAHVRKEYERWGG
jgi:tripartite-type tricarboxylate transporter receptor subunit TctC